MYDNKYRSSYLHKKHNSLILYVQSIYKYKIPLNAQDNAIIKITNEMFDLLCSIKLLQTVIFLPPLNY